MDPVVLTESSDVSIRVTASTTAEPVTHDRLQPITCVQLHSIQRESSLLTYDNDYIPR